MLKYRYYGEQLLLIVWEPSISSAKGNENLKRQHERRVSRFRPKSKFSGPWYMDLLF